MRWYNKMFSFKLMNKIKSWFSEMKLAYFQNQVLKLIILGKWEIY